MLIVTNEMNDLNDKLNSVQRIGNLGFWQYNVNTKYRFWSKEIYRMFGLKYGMPIPKLEEIYEMIHAEDLPIFIKCREMAISDGKPFEIDLRIKKVGSTSGYKWYHVIGYLQISNDNNHKVLYFIVIDIHQYKLNEDKIASLQKVVIQSEKMSILGQLSSGVAHEINNPLSFTLSNMQILQARFDFISQLLNAYQSLLHEIEKLQLDNLKEIYETISTLTHKKDITHLLADTNDTITESIDGLERIKNIIIKMREFSGTDKKSMESININDCILDAIQIISKESKSNCKIYKNLSDIPSTLGSHTQLIIVFVNLLLNAQEAVQDDGSIKITSDCFDSKIIVTISDNGSGIDVDNMEKVFTPFFTTKPTGSGTGLGLATVYGIMKLHDGKITFESEKDRGTIFTVELPVKQIATEQ